MSEILVVLDKQVDFGANGISEIPQEILCTPIILENLQQESQCQGQQPRSQEICINCCTVFSPSWELDTNNKNNNEETVQVQMSLLKRIFGFQHADLISGIPIPFPENCPLCFSCSRILANLGECYEEFVNLQRMESLLYKSISRLDEIIRRGLKNVQLPENEKSQPEIICSNVDISKIKTEPQDLREVARPNNKIDPILNSKASFDKGPWVRITRLRMEDLPNAGRNKNNNNANSSGENKTGNADFVGKTQLYGDETDSSEELGVFDDVEFSNNSEFSEDDSDYAPKKKKQKRESTSFPKKLSAAPPEEPKNSTPKKSKAKKGGSKPKKIKNGIKQEDGNMNSSAGDKKNKSRKRTIRHGRFYELLFRRQQAHPFPCIYCPEDFDAEDDRIEHVKAAHVTSSEPVICAKCGKVFGDEARRKCHEPKCGKIPSYVHLPPYICKYCSKEYSTWSKVSTHTRQVHTAERRYICDMCPFKTITQYVLDKHKRGVHGKYFEITCPECSKLFKTREQYEGHRERLHGKGYEKYKKNLEKGNQRRKERLPPPPTSFVCQLCNIDFVTKNRLSRHRLEFHEVEKKYMCDQCGKSFVSYTRLKKHIEYAHTDERPFICDQCGKNFKSMDNLKCHVSRSHTEEGRLKYNEYSRQKNKARQLLAQQQQQLQQQQSKCF